MVRLREIPRTAAFAWSPGFEQPLVVTGTRAGAVDADFSDETQLEIWELSLDDVDHGIELQPIACIATDSRFHDIAWAPPNAEHPKGVIAGALDNGSLDLWDAEKLLNGNDNAFISRTTKHSGPIKSLQFNPLKPQILATAGAKGELFIYDVNDISNPFRLGTAAARSDDLECVAWNRKVPHILATGGSGGFVTVWDLKTKKASLTLNNSRRAVGAIAWDPNNATKLLTATPDDASPVILLWDLRNSNAPERTLHGHEQGVLSLSWCQQDSSLLLSCGKDNRTLCWDPTTGEKLGEFPEVTNWTFQTRFDPSNPNLMATASFDGKISIQTLQNTNASSQTLAQAPSDGEDFFTKAQTQPQGSSFSLKKAPKWFERPIGASFGFGGKLVSFSLQSTAAGQPRSSKVQISQFSADTEIGEAADTFENSLSTGDLSAICQAHISEAKTDDEKADWEVIQTLIAENPRKGVIGSLGFKEREDGFNGLNAEDSENGNEGLIAVPQEDGRAGAKSQRLSTLFADGADGDDFLSNLTATKGAKTDNPFHLYSETDSASDRDITKALMLGQFEKAVGICLKEDRLADAFMIANCGGKELLDKVQAAYLGRKAQGPNYLRLLASVIGKNLWDIVYNADLESWKEAMATLCTFADPIEFPDLCETLGDRIIEGGSRRDASFCYLVGSKLEKVIDIWVAELQETEKAFMLEPTGNSTFSVHARVLQGFIEKVTIFRQVTNFEDKERSATSDWKLNALYEKYTEYADIIAAHGKLSTAEKYLDLLPSKYPAAEVARNRVNLASRKLDMKPLPRQQQQQQQLHQQQQFTNKGSAPKPRPSQYLPAQQQASQVPPQRTPTNAPYAPHALLGSTPASNPNVLPNTNMYQQNIQGYTPYGGLGQATTPFNQGAVSTAFAPPPRISTPTAPPPTRPPVTSNWNDTPMVTKPPPPRKGTPSMVAAPTTSQYQNQQGFSMPSQAPPFGGQRATPTPPAPPPKGPAPPRVSSPLNNIAQPTYQNQRPSSSAATTYAPPLGQNFGQPMTPSTIARGASPYNPPPTGSAPSSRYTPTPAQQSYTQSNVPQPHGMPMRPPPPSHSYSQQPLPSGPNNAYASIPTTPSGMQSGPPAQFAQGGPPPGPPRGPGPMDAPTAPPKASVAPVKARHPPGDRSHIPANAQQMVEIFSNDMQRVASKAPPEFAALVKDTQKRLGILYDHLNNEELLSPETIQRLGELAQALQAKRFDEAARMQVDIQREKTEECGKWMVGVKKLIGMSKASE